MSSRLSHLGSPILVLQVRIRSRPSEQAEHCDDLALVMKGVRDHVVQNESRAPQGSTPFSRTLDQAGIELCLRESLDVGDRVRHDPLLVLLERLDGEARILPAIEGDVLQAVHPALFAGDDMGQLIANAGAAKAGQLLDEFFGRQDGGMPEQQVQALVGPGM